MDFIDDVDDDEVEQSGSIAKEESGGDKLLSDLHNTLFIELMKLKPTLKKHKADSSTDITLPKEVAIVVAEEIIGTFTNVVQFKDRLCTAKFDRAKIISVEKLSSCEQMFDIIVDVSSFTLNNAPASDSSVVEVFSKRLMPGGAVLTINSPDFIASKFSVFEWILPERIDSKSHDNAKSVFVLRRRCIACNEIAAIYWHPVPTKKDKKLCQSVIDRERAWIEQISVPISVHEYETGVFSDVTHHRAVQNILQHGVCIFPHLFDVKETKDWGKHALDDMKSVVSKLTDRGIDLLNPSEANPRIENYHEMSMREALRCDLRNGRSVKQKSREVYGEERKTTSVYKEPTNYHTHLPPSKNIRFHPAIRAVLAEAMNPPAPTEHERKGNWGRYNFEGPGPEVVPEPKIGSVGVVMSLPGCADQTIHADTSHTYVHTHLPPHYLNLFTPGIDRERNAIRPVEGSSKMQYESFAVGQTCFVVGSHTLDMCGRVMATDEGQLLLEERLVRPQLDAGDALIFDCRILHFGTANQSNNPKVVNDSYGIGGRSEGTFGWRPMLYVNYHQDWFHDPKNWNDNEKLFVDNV